MKTTQHLTAEIIQKGIDLLGVDPRCFYQKCDDNKAYLSPSLIRASAGLDRPCLGVSHHAMFEDKYGKQGANFIFELPKVIQLVSDTV